MTLLPHRPPFLMIDRVVDMVSGISATGLKEISAGECCLPPDGPAGSGFPRVLVLEAMAQTAAVVALHGLGVDRGNAATYFLGIQDVTFESVVPPGKMLRLAVRLDHNRGPVSKFKAEASVGEECVARASFLAALVDVTEAASAAQGEQ